MNIKHVQRTVNLNQGDSQKEVTFSEIFGNIVGYATKVIGTMPAGETADIEIKDGGNNVLMPIDIGVSEMTTKSTFQGMMAPLQVSNPGNIQALVRPSAPLGSGESYKVKVIIFYDASTYNQQNFARY